MVKEPNLPHLTINTVRKNGKVYRYWLYRGPSGRKNLGPVETDWEIIHRLYFECQSGKAFRTASGRTFADLIKSYKASARYLDNIGPRSRADYDRVLAYIDDKMGRADCRKMERHIIIKAQQDLAAKGRTRFGNYLTTVLSILFEHAMDLGWRTTNPAKGTTKLRTGEGYKPWPQWAVENMRREAGGPVLTAFELALGTGQRIGDVLKMRWDDIEDDGINVVQEKTGAVLWVPFTDHLRDFLATVPKGVRTTIVCDEKGRAFTYQRIEKRLRGPRARAGADGYSFHGLRYNAAQELYEMGCSDKQVMAITGHATDQMARKYGKGANQRRIARQVRELRRKDNG